ncbi:glycosyltransferase [Pectobacterium aroidearum]|uniref:glycosyltransferase n=1 Tax=Pectobacterium aroidearum TaxID=1201031 RepID=UPI002115C971|nr:glycosyltransferase family 2 protein [Pectobacterium aroidearum]UUE43779.1 glycosyltransferase family 2 protein [Pectobacterium aroidearum]UUE51445.1 glycosyltransferase family 2 protein [Pectobacterium aroidearum]UUE55666.1 glycosyltransferase family 2 protein [Pectobacterium aroidearum]UUE60613.1 glycosyltransferase family 2 protein [Pectobacterium aroidearum]UUE64836.1 glycosyltransferase family 2 protein [Pectobacterium aroidearum]
MKCFIAIPTYNGGNVWKVAAESLKRYGVDELRVQVIDSGSNDITVEIANELGFNIIHIDAKEFNHGGTRNQLVEANTDYDVVIFLTQDAIPESGYIDRILSAFDDPNVVCAYGRQLPHYDANPIAQHARYFNYPEKSGVYSFNDAKKMGLKTVFMSNSFSAYRIDVFRELGGFPSNTILCEDMYFTAKSVLAGYKVAYVSDAIVRHSHNYSPLDEFKRYFDIGVFHADEPWIRKKFGGAGGEGKRFIFSELRFLLKKNLLYIPVAFLNNFMKIAGYKLGQNYKRIPRSLVKAFSMHKRYWH